MAEYKRCPSCNGLISSEGDGVHPCVPDSMTRWQECGPRPDPRDSELTTLRGKVTTLRERIAEMAQSAKDCCDQIARLSDERDQAQNRVKELEYLLLEVNKRVMPGTSDSVDGMLDIIRERDRYREALEKIAGTPVWTEAYAYEQREIASEALRDHGNG